MEIWRDIPEWEGFYEVSDLGAVRSKARTSTAGRGLGQYQGVTLKASVMKIGYATVTLSRPGRTRQAYVHRLVSEAFIGVCPPGQEVCHGDGNPLNNTLQNLRYDTRLGNAADRASHGRNRTAGLPGEANPKAKLTNEKVRFIRANGDATLKTLGAATGVSLSTVALVRNNKTWNHVK